MTCLESFVGFAEISQWPLEFITRFQPHVLMNAFTFAFASDMFGIFCEICRNQAMAPRFNYSGSCTCEGPPFERQRQRQRQRQTDRQRETEKVRQENSHTSRHKERQQERQTDKQKHFLYVSPFLALSVPC